MTKRFFILYLALSIWMVSATPTAIAQRTQFPHRGTTESEPTQKYKDWFSVNLPYLSDVEGIYDVSMIPKYCGGNLLFGLREWGGHEIGTTAVIFKNADNTYSCRFLFSSNAQNYQWHFGTDVFTLTPLTESANILRLNGLYSERYDHFGNSGNLRFNIETRIVWDRGLIEFDFAGNDEFHMVNAKVSMIKTYPTTSQINNVTPQQPQQPIPEETYGSGFALKNGYIVTNYHVVKNAQSIQVQGIKRDFNKKFNATIVATDKTSDIAIIKIDDTSFSGFGTIPYNIKTTISAVGEDVFVLGYPLTTTMGDEIKLTTGIISSRTGYEGDVSLYQISAPIQPGNSGSPMFDSKGNLIGIICAIHRDAEDVGYAIKTSYLYNLVESASLGSILPINNLISSLSLSAKVEKIESFVFMITCSNVSNGTASSRVFVNPTITSTAATHIRINSVTTCSQYTAVEFRCINDYVYNGFCSIDKETHIVVNGTSYPMIKAENIKISPEKTLFSYYGQELVFTLYFSPIPTSTTIMDLIEPGRSDWKFYGIQLK